MQNDKPTLAWIGAGAVATSLALALEKAQYFTQAVYARRRTQAQALCQRLAHAVVSPSPDLSTVPCHLAFLAVADDAIAAMADKVSLRSETCLVHLSASVSLSSLQAHHKGPCGVFYPLQTFSSQTLSSFQGVYVFIEGSHPTVAQQLCALARAIGAHPYLLGAHQRQRLHVSAVLTHNFSNYLLQCAQEWMKENELPFQALEPLMRTMLRHAFSIGPAQAQSGPAKRGDAKTLQQHLQLLEHRPAWKALYEMFTQHLGAQNKQEE